MKILIIQLRRVGDILLTTPVISYLKQVLPNAEVDFLCEPMGKAVLETNPELRNLLIYEKSRPLKEIERVRAEKYDVVFDFMNNPRSVYLTALSGARCRVGYRHGLRSLLYNFRGKVPVEPEYVPLRKLRLVREWLDVCGHPTVEPTLVRPRLSLAESDVSFARDWMKNEGLTSRAFVVMAPIHRHSIRAWTRKGFRELGVSIASKRKLPVYLAWGPGEEESVQEVRKDAEDVLRILPKTSQRQMAAIFSCARFVVSNCSGAMHLAVAVNTPTVTIYGPTRPIDWNPSLAEKGNKSDLVIQASGVPCLGCHLTSNCPVGHICMNNLPTETVFRACEKLLSED